MPERPRGVNVWPRPARDALGTRADLDFHEALDYLPSMLTLSLGTEDAIEGRTAVPEKHSPVWKGR